MAESSTDGNNDEGRPRGQPMASTHDSNPGEGGGDGADDSDLLPRGATLGRYLVLERLGAGAMGVVYAAYDPELDRKVAIKILRQQEGAGDRARRQARLVREAKAIAKLSHPNVVSVFDVGVHDGQVFLAMEYLSGGTLRDWMTAAKRPWRDVVHLFVEIGRGLAAAHAEGLIHRDFKPDNVLLDKNGKPKVVDFGLVRLDMDLATTLDAAVPGDGLAVPATPAALPEGLTQTGALAGTPAYMAPEQFLGKPIDARTDQFAFCVALYELLYGERPFAGETVMSVADAVTAGRLRPLPKNADVPGWVRLCVLRGLRTDPAQRYPRIDDLLVVLANDPVARRRRQLIAIGASTLLIVSVVGVRHMLLSKRQEIDRQVAADVALATSALSSANDLHTEAKALRDRALADFDNYDGEKGEDLWAKSLDLTRRASNSYEQAIQQLEAATTLAPGRDLKDRTADAIVASLTLDGITAAEHQAVVRRLALYDDGTRLARLIAPARVQIDTTPERMEAALETYAPSTFKVLEPARTLGPTPLSIQLAPGSYRVIFKGTTHHVGFVYPLLVTAGEHIERVIPVPRSSDVPANFVYVPEGHSLFGSQDEDDRQTFLQTTPLHDVEVKAFLISKYEATIGDWILFLDTLSPAERQARRPHGSKDGVGGFIDLRPSGSADWDLAFRATNQIYRATEQTPFRYEDRSQLVSQNWLRFPVSGISPEDAVTYAAWLNASSRVRDARLCTEREWERASRGADARPFPHANQLMASDANFDLTYGRKNRAYGPDEVGSHPASASPFEVHDLIGNVWEITSSVLDEGQFVARGGSFYQDRRAALSTNRDPLSSVTRDHTIGVRICADVQL